jgi:hypothetical protein
MRIICFIFGHNWTKWKYVKSIGRYDEQLTRRCKRCSNTQHYSGLVDLDSKGNKIPYKV